MKTVLSIDGGGIRGVIPALVLAEIETRSRRAASDLFDLLAGTSTGGIIALGLCHPGSTGKPTHAARDLADLYLQQGEQIFDRSLWRSLRSVGALLEERYDADSLETILQASFGHTPLGDALCPILVTGYELQTRATVFMKSWHPRFRDLEMWLAARATSAAPTYFEPARASIDGSLQALVDGGVFVNNPALSAYAEARRLWPEEEILLVSLGTGEQLRSFPFEKARDWGLAQWAGPLLSCMFDGSSKAVDYQLEQLLGENYYRFQVDLREASDDMDDVSDKNLAHLQAEAARLLEIHTRRLAELLSRIPEEV